MALLDGLISYWKLDEASGTRVDSHTGGNDLTDNNTVTQVAGKISNAGQFTLANSEHLSRADNISLSTGDIDFTIAGWVYLDTKPGEMGLFGKYTIGGNQREYLVSYESGGDRFRFYISNNGTATTTIDANNLGSPSTGTWYYIVAWHDATANTINIQVNNGTVNSTAHTTGAFDSSSSFNIGAIGDPLLYHNGRVDEVGFWKKVLTSDERTQLYNGGSGLAYSSFTSAGGGGGAFLFNFI